jgi:cytochrome c551/c552
MREVYVIPPGRLVHSTLTGKRCSNRKIVVSLPVILLVLSICLAAAGVIAQDNDRERNLAASLASLDPGPRPGFVPAPNPYPNFPNNPGNPIQLLTMSGQFPAFQGGLSQFIEVEPVDLAGGPGNGGLGPTFNSNSCGSCHSQPAAGGTSPRADVGPAFLPNPQATVGQGFTIQLSSQIVTFENVTPPFITQDGPVREARFKSDSGVHDLFTIAGSNDAPTCTKGMMSQPDFAAEAARGNLSFRIPTPVFGAGLIENIDEDTLITNLANSSSVGLGIHGTFNRSGNDGSITRFGWKAQNKSLLMFAGEAYNVEMGITNELFPDERGYPPNPIPTGCLVNPTPEDLTVFDPSLSLSDVAQFAIFMRYLDQPAQACGGTTGIDCGLAAAGQVVFTKIGCANCHTPSMTTTMSEFTPAALSGVTAKLFSDLALHHMGSRLADGITQGNAGPDQFRTSPLWGVGQRVFFLHDGRTSNLVQAILDHESPGSESNRVIENFERLALTDKTNLIVFLRSL